MSIIVEALLFAFLSNTNIISSFLNLFSISFVLVHIFSCDILQLVANIGPTSFMMFCRYLLVVILIPKSVLLKFEKFFSFTINVYFPGNFLFIRFFLSWVISSRYLYSVSLSGNIIGVEGYPLDFERLA